MKFFGFSENIFTLRRRRTFALPFRLRRHLEPAMRVRALPEFHLQNYRCVDVCDSLANKRGKWVTLGAPRTALSEWVEKVSSRPSELDCDLFAASLATENPKERPSCGSPAAWRQIKCQFPELLSPNALIISLLSLVYGCRFNFHKYQRDTLALCNKSNEFQLAGERFTTEATFKRFEHFNLVFGCARSNWIACSQSN